MINVRPGSKVHYITGSGKVHNGIIKDICPGQIITEVFVVYDCAENWHLYKEYTGVRTKIKELFPGWKKKLDFRLNSLIRKTIHNAHRDS